MDVPTDNRTSPLIPRQAARVRYAWPVEAVTVGER